MIAHVVLFRPKSTLTDEQRSAFVRALDDALNNIPLIARASIGRRTMMGRHYDAMNAVEFPFVAMLEFDSRADLLAYLAHPAHEALGQQFYTTAEAALAYDFELLAPSETGKLLE